MAKGIEGKLGVGERLDEYPVDRAQNVAAVDAFDARPRGTRWSTTLPSKVTFPRAINLRVKSGAHLVT